MVSYHTRKKALKICSVNIIHLKNRIEELVEYINSNDIDIACIQETGLKDKDHLVIPGYNIIRKDIQANNHRGICTVIKDSIDYKINDWYGQSCVSQVSIRINTTSQGYIDMVNFYQDCNTDLNEPIFELTAQNSHKYLLICDFNSSHTDIGCSHTNSRGEKLMDILENQNLVIFNDENPTFYHRASGNPNILDLAIGTTNIASHVNFYVGSDVGSDHMPIHVEIDVAVCNVKKKSIRNIASIDWGEYSKSIKENLKILEIENNKSIDREINNLSQAIHTTLDKLAPKTEIKKRKWWSFTNEIKEKIKYRRYIRRLQKKYHTPHYNTLYNKINREVKCLIENQKKIDWEILSENLNNKNPKLAWSTIRKVTSKTDNPNTGNKPLLNDEGSKALTSQEKANMMAKHLKNKQSIPDDRQFDQPFRNKVDQYVKDHPSIFKPHTSEEEHNLNIEVSLIELEQIFKKCKNKSSPGPDEISYQMLKMLPVIVKLHMCHIFSKCIQWGYFPNKWKEAHVKMIPKPGKDKTLVKNHRPISLISCFGKLLERIITKRLINHLTEHNLISKYQCGFLPKHSTDIHLFRLSQDIYSGFKRTQATAALFLDVDGAFDRVWVNGLKYKLLDYSLPTNIITRHRR